MTERPAASAQPAELLGERRRGSRRAPSRSARPSRPMKYGRLRSISARQIGSTAPSAFCSSVTPQRRSTSLHATPRCSHSRRTWREHPLDQLLALELHVAERRRDEDPDRPRGAWSAMRPDPGTKRRRAAASGSATSSFITRSTTPVDEEDAEPSQQDPVGDERQRDGDGEHERRDQHVDDRVAVVVLGQLGDQQLLAMRVTRTPAGRERR